MVCPLDWGLGHATRCIPVIRELQKQGAEVIIATEKRPLELLKKEFPSLCFIPFPGYNISYPENGSMALKMFFSIPSILKKISDEKKLLREIVKREKIDGVISDNRYGLGISEVPTAIIIHQLMVKSFFGENILHRITLNYVNSFTRCWIPDVAGKENFSGDLSHKFPLPENAVFVGVLSRFSDFVREKQNEKKYNLAVVISGPEPQRTVFEKLVLEQTKKLSPKILIVLGKPEFTDITNVSENVELAAHLDSEKLFHALSASELILSRPGYSTVMDLAVLGKKAIFVPTPGQTEQEYLGSYFHQEKMHLCVRQDKLDIAENIKQVVGFKGFQPVTHSDLLPSAVANFLVLC